MTALLLVICSITPPDEALLLAEGLYRAGGYDAAVTELQRFICFSPDTPAIAEAWQRIASAHAEQERWFDAVAAVRRAIYFSSDDSLRDTRRLLYGEVMIAAREYSAAESELLRVAMFGKYQSVKRRAWFLLGISRLHTFKWDEARLAFARTRDSAAAPTGPDLDSLLDPRCYPRARSPELARWLSTFVPGAGQMYAGAWWPGLNALALNAGLGYMVVSDVVRGDVGAALADFMAFFYRYYSGNRFRAGELARKHNEMANRAHAESVLARLAEYDN